MDVDAILKEHAGAIGRVAQTYARGDADDLAQDIALAVWRALPTFRGECSLRTFILRIAHNRGLAWLARARNRPVPAPLVGVDLENPAPSAESRIVKAEAHDRLVAAIHQLPLGQRQVLTLALEGLDHAAIAEVLGISENNVAVRLSRARDALRTILGADHG